MRVYEWRCLMTSHKLAKGDKYSKGFVQRVDRKKKIRWGVCEFHANLEAKMAQYRLKKTLEKP